MNCTLARLPQEILHHILIYLPPTAVLKFQQVCHAFNEICGPLLWRTICLTHFRYWSSTRELQHKLAVPVDQIQWKRIFAERYHINQHVSRTLDSILSTQVGRIEKTGSIVQHGYDAKDVLLENLHVGKDAPDVLAREWYSRAALTCLHRGAALEQLLDLRQGSGDHVPLERALGLFDLFIIQDGKGDPRDISAKLDDVADEFRLLHPEHMEMNGRERAIAVADFVLAQGLGGIQRDGDAHYHDLRNNFLGMALRNDQRSALPLISVVIYCCIAQRVALDARPCGFPWHVLAIVHSANGESLNGRQPADTSVRDRMYMDPFRSADEVRVETLVAQLASMGVSHMEQDRLLDVASTTEIVSRCARNIIRSFQTLPRHNVAGDDSPSMDAALYGALWTLLLLSGDQGENPAGYHRLRYFPVVLKHVEAYFPNDVHFVEKLCNARIADFGPGDLDLVDTVRSRDNLPRPVKTRGSSSGRNVDFRIGQVFRHKRYQYYAIITGWDTECSASEQWMTEMRIHELPRGRSQSFYHVLVEDKTMRYVAEENIEIVRDEPVAALLTIAGQYFKRWDGGAKSFVSNIRDQYPDD